MCNIQFIILKKLQLQFGGIRPFIAGQASHPHLQDFCAIKSERYTHEVIDLISLSPNP